MPGQGSATGSAGDANNSGWDNASDGSESSSEQQDTSQDLDTESEDTSAGSLNTDEESEDGEQETGEEEIGEEGEEEQEEEGVEEETDEEGKRFDKHPRFQQMLKQIKDQGKALAQLQAQLAQTAKVAQYYQQRENQRSLQREVGDQDQASARKGRVPQVNYLDMVPELSLPPGLKGPPIRNAKGEFEGGWADQAEMAPYIDHRAAQIADHMMEEAYTKNLKPVLERVNRSVSKIREHLAKQIHPDYPEVVKEAYDDIFVLDPGGHVVGTKNPALLQYFRSQEFPELAMYEYAMTKRAPQAVKKGTQQATKKALQKLNTRPKVPSKPMGKGKTGALPELGWDDPPDVADKKLKRSGVRL